MKINQLKAGALLSYGAMILKYIISLLYTPIMLRLLGQSEYGLFQLVSSVIAYLGLLNFGFGSTYVRFFIRYKVEDKENNISKLNGMFLIIFTVIGLISVIAGTILAFNAEFVFGNKLTMEEIEQAKILMLILTVNIAITFPSTVFTSYLTIHERFIFQKLLQIIKVFCEPFVILPALLMGYGSIGMVTAITLVSIGIAVANISYCIKKLKMRFSFREFDIGLMKEMSVFSVYVFISMLIDKVNWQVDKLILGRFHGTVTVAIYALASQLSTYYISISASISSVFAPMINKMVASDKGKSALDEIFVKVGRVQFIILSLIATGLVFFGKQFISIWAGEEYSDSYRIAILLIIPATVPLIQNIGIQIQQAMNMHKFRSLLYLAIAILNIAVTIPLAKAYGGFGAAIGTAGAHIIGHLLIMNWYYHVKIGLNIKHFWKQIGRLSFGIVPSIVAGYLLTKYIVINNIFTLLLWGMCYIIIFFVSMWILGMNNFERDLIRKPLNRIIRK